MIEKKGSTVNYTDYCLIVISVVIEDSIYFNSSLKLMASEIKFDQILVTGGFGQIGNFLIKNLISQFPNSNIVVIDNLCNKKNIIKSDQIIHLNKNFENIIDYADEIDVPDIIFHLAAQISVPYSVKEPELDFKSNALGTLTLLNWAKEHHVQNFVTIGSAATIGEPEIVPISESHPHRPLSPYGISKMIAEIYTIYFNHHFGLNYKVVRPFNIYSEMINENDPYSGVIAKFFKFARQEIPFTIEGDGSQIRDFIYADDVAKIIINSLYTNDSSIFNGATGVGTTIMDLANLIAATFNIEPKFEFLPPREGDIHTSVGVKSKLFNFEPTSLEIGMKILYEVLGK